VVMRVNRLRFYEAIQRCGVLREKFFFLLSCSAIRGLLRVLLCETWKREGFAHDTKVQQYLLGYSGSMSSEKEL
jgi:hypothetical protein